MTSKYEVVYGDYAKRHYLKDFEKRYRGKVWIETQKSFFLLLESLDVYKIYRRESVERLDVCDRGELYKVEFKIAGSKDSAHTSGNRMIVYSDNQIRENTILLIYAKTDVSKRQHETVWREQCIKNNYPYIADLFPRFQK